MLAKLCPAPTIGHKLTHDLTPCEVAREGRTLRSRNNIKNGKLTCRFSCCNDTSKKTKANGNSVAVTNGTEGAEKFKVLPADDLKQSALNQIFTATRGSQQLSPSKRTQPTQEVVSVPTRKTATPPESTTTSPSTPHKIFVVDVEKEAKEKKVLTPSTGLSNLKIQPKKDVKPKVRRKLNADDAVGSHKLTEYFPIRRSERKPKNIITEIEKYNVEQAVISGKEEGLKVQLFPEKGRGIVTTRCFKKGEFVLEYAGDLIDIVEAKKREAVYSQDQNLGSFMYYFQYKNVSYCIDATAECPRLGRLVNHSRNGNLATRTIEIKNQPRLILIARRDIEVGEEILYDYGDRSKEALANHPWLAY